jgi:predicted transcriptional regulator
MNLDQVGELLEEILEKGPESIQKIEERIRRKLKRVLLSATVKLDLALVVRLSTSRENPVRP